MTKKDIIQYVFTALVLIATFVYSGIYYICLFKPVDEFCECGGHYELFDIEHNDNSILDYYYYKCNKCGNTAKTAKTVWEN